jgi:hypothetical protein
MSRDARDKLVRDILRDGWASSNTYGLTPTIIFGWYDDKPDDQPALTLRRQTELPFDGGQTGYAAFDPSGAGAIQRRTGVVRCHIWVETGDLGSAPTDFPEPYAYEVVEEIKRITEANQDQPTNPDTGNQPVQGLAPGEDDVVPEPEKSGVFHRFADVTYWYTDD